MNEHNRPNQTRTSESTLDSFAHPERIGPYRILQVIGEGGMGVVYDAEQVEPVQRRVAVKMMKVGMDTKEVVARFEAERQALAVMDHPGIARVLDAGATEAGRPYFVMERVQGIPLNEYCDLRKLGMVERLRLFVSICQAVQHAHQKGVIHRDLKPSNVLVTEQDGKPVPKIIDFGIAKAISQRLTEKTLVTAYGIAVGTPAYMSPEQAEMSGLDIDTRTDIYSLGVMLYELLSGELPIDPKQYGLQGFIAQLVARATDAPTPSNKVSLSGKADYLATLRGTNPQHLRKELKGDLDWIVMRAMDKDRARRYETANGLAMDLQRYLASEPVVARPPSARYRATKFIRRNRAAVIAASAVVIALVAGAVLATVGVVRATRAEALAQREAQVAQQVSDFLVSLFEVSDPSEARGNTITAREILDRGAEKIEGELADQPLVQARLMATMGDVFEALGLYREARELFRAALQLRTDQLPSADPLVLASMYDLATVQYDLGEYQAAESLLTERQRLASEAQVHDSILAAGELFLGAIEYARGEYEAAAQAFERVVALREKVHGADHQRVADALYQLGALNQVLGKLDESERQLRRALSIAERNYDPDAPELIGFINNLGATRYVQGEYDDAERLYRRALAIAEQALGPQHDMTAMLLHNVGELLATRNQHADAVPVLERALATKEAALGPDHRSTSTTLAELGKTYHALGRYGDAEPLLRRALAIRERLMGPRHPQVAEALRSLAHTLRALGRTDEAARLDARAEGIEDGGL